MRSANNEMYKSAFQSVIIKCEKKKLIRNTNTHTNSSCVVFSASLEKNEHS